MYVIVRSLKVKKGYKEAVINNFKKPSPVEASPGFIKKELLYSDKHQEYDIASTYIYFKNKEAYHVWHTSDAHKEGHKNRSKENLEYFIEMTREAYEVVV